MPYLGEYLGHLLSEIATARVQADLETVRMAELYASHPLLKHLPVPRFRLPTLTLDVPVVIQDVEAAQPDISLLGSESASALREGFNRLLDLQLARAGIALADKERLSLNETLAQVVAGYLAARSFDPANAGGLVEDMIAATVKFIAYYSSAAQTLAADPARLQGFEGDLRAAALAPLPDKPAGPSRLLVQVTNTALRDAGPSELMTRLHLSVSEDAVEWTTVESQGQTVERLLPE